MRLNCGKFSPCVHLVSDGISAGSRRYWTVTPVLYGGICARSKHSRREQSRKAPSQLMLVHQAYRFELSPNNVTRSRFASHCGASRFAYNWGLALVKKQLAAREQVRLAGYKELLSDDEVDGLARQVEVPWSTYGLRKEFNRQKQVIAPWWSENSKFAYVSGLTALGDALSNFSKSKKGARVGASMGFPRVKKRGSHQSCQFQAERGLAVVDARHIRLPRIGLVRSKEMTSELLSRLDAGTARILNVMLSQEAGRWFASFCCEVERTDSPARFPDAVVGVDLGVKHLAVLSTGECIENPKALNRYQRKMARLQRELSRRQAGSKRRAQTKAKLARCHRHVRCIRFDALHQVTTNLASTYGTVIIEDLNVKGMTASPKPVPDPDRPGAHLRNGKTAKAGLNRAVLDVAPGNFRRQLTYKLEWHGGQLIIADRWYPSSKICSSCGTAKAKLSLKVRTYRCDECGLVIDRDLNAARNLASLAVNVAAGRAETQNGRGGDDPRLLSESSVKRQDGREKSHKTVLDLKAS